MQSKALTIKFVTKTRLTQRLKFTVSFNEQHNFNKKVIKDFFFSFDWLYYHYRIKNPNYFSPRFLLGVRIERVSPGWITNSLEHNESFQFRLHFALKCVYFGEKNSKTNFTSFCSLFMRFVTFKDELTSTRKRIEVTLSAP